MHTSSPAFVSSRVSRSPATGRRAWLLAVALAFAGLASGPGVPTLAAELADRRVFSRITADELLEILQQEGYSASPLREKSVSWKVEGYKTQLLISDDSESIQFHTAFNESKATLRKTNDWNKSMRFSRTYLDDDGDPHLELDLELTGGVTRERLADFMKTCRLSFSAWIKQVVE